jgi:uncharacterized protein (TIGR02246 family)
MTLMTQPADLSVAFQSAWNAHDMAAFRELFHADATFVNRFAALSRGVEPIIAQHRMIHETILRDSTLESEPISSDEIADGAAVVHFWTRLSAGAAHPLGPHQVDTLILAVVTRREGVWRIQAAENVTMTNPMTGAVVLRS